jgi:C-terminal processing protease CtpA/Prc
MSTRSIIIVIAAAFAGRLAAQNPQPCTSRPGPGAAFGITSYQCARCGIRQEKDRRTLYVFDAEPVVLEAAARGMLRAGDVIEAVNGKSITTREGADLFTYPPPGQYVVTVRRAGLRTQIATAPAVCTGDNDPLIIVDGVPLPTPERFAGNEGRFGFAVSCTPSCTRTRATDGSTYWKYDGYPPIVAVRPRGPAENVGLRVGDVITRVDGLSVLEEPGALRLFRSETKETLYVTVLRDGKETGYLLHAR